MLCLNKRQVAFGEPAKTLTKAVLEATYGAAIVMVPDGGSEPISAILPPHHHDEP